MRGRWVKTKSYHTYHAVNTSDTICKKNQERQLTDSGVMPEMMKDILQVANAR